MSNQELQVITDNTGANDEQPKVERLSNEVYIQAGNYCVALADIQTDIRDKHGLIEQGETLLIASLNLAHEKIHSVTVKPHPRYFANINGRPKYYEFLFEDFCNKFRVISTVDGNAVRQREMAELQGQVNQKQKALFEIQADPQRMSQIVMNIYSRRIEHKETPNFIAPSGEVNAVEVIEAGVTPAMIEQLRESATQYQDLLNIQCNWLMEKQTEIREMMDAIMPYGIELASAQQASMQEINRDIKKRQTGIETLELYVGKNVFVKQIVEGEDADPSIKLTVVQERLFADVELSLFTEKAVYFDASKKSLLWEQFKTNPEFVKQIFPTERCIVLMACNAKEKDYGNIFENEFRNEQNATVFLLVRNGGNIHVVYSPISSHLVAARLFPSKEEIERHLFKGKDKINISIDDLEYSTRMQFVEQEILHFKRFILLIAGLDHREKLFGHFYPQNEMLNFFYPEFQDKYMNFIHDADGEGMLPTQEEHRPTLIEYCTASNNRLTKGSRVIVDAKSIIDEDSAPSCFVTRKEEDAFQNYEPVERFFETRVQLDSKGFFVKVPVKHSWDSSKRSFEARVALPSYISMTSILCLDGIFPDDLQFYIESRKYRHDFASYIELFSFAKQYIIRQYQGYEPLIEYLEEAVTHIPDAHFKGKLEKKQMVYATLSTWFSANNGYPLLNPNGDNKEVHESLLLQLNFRASPSFRAQYADYALKALENTPEIAPLRLCVDCDNNLWLYTTLQPNERLDAIERNMFVMRSQLNVSKRGRVTLKKGAEVLLDQFTATEYAVYEWEGKEAYVLNKEQDLLFKTYKEKHALLDVLDNAPSMLKSFFTGEFSLEQAKLLLEGFCTYFKRVTRSEKYYSPSPVFYLPLFVANQTLYALRVYDSMELYNYLIDRFDLQDELLDQFGTIHRPTENTQYSTKLSLYTTQFNSYSSRHFIQTYKPRFDSADLYSTSLRYSSESLRGDNIDKDGIATLTHALHVANHKLSTAWHGFRQKTYTAAELLMREDAYTAFSVEDLINYRDFRFDKMYNNPFYREGMQIKSADIYLYGATCKETGELKDAVIIANSVPLDDQAAKDFTSNLINDFKLRNAAHEIRQCGWGLEAVYSFKDVEQFYTDVFNQIERAFFSREKEIQGLARAAEMTANLSDLNIAYEKDGAIIFTSK